MSNQINVGGILRLDRSKVTQAGRETESQALRRLHRTLTISDAARERILANARELVVHCREHAHERSFLDQFMAEYGLSSSAGVALMCICEALLRIPDERTADALLAEKLSTADWSAHLGHSASVFLNASTWALLLTGKTFALQPAITTNVADWILSLVGRIGEVAVRAAMSHAVRILGNEFVFGSTISEALDRADRLGVACSFDMLGEGARTAVAADQYFEAYMVALRSIASANKTAACSSGMSIKLSALHPRYEPLQRRRVVTELGERLYALAVVAADLGVPISIDAEETNRLELSLELFETLASSRSFNDWNGLGFVVQAYSKRALPIVEWLDSLACATGRIIPVRLVKGAYWDAEIKAAQVDGLPSYPVFTRKSSTDLAWLAVLQRLFASDRLFAQVATHNAYAVAAALQLAGDREFEFQRLHGMGDLLYARAQAQYSSLRAVRVYAPVGEFKNLLSYLVRRLLENGANASFVNRFLDDELAVDEVIQDPIALVEGHDFQPHAAIKLPQDLYGARRANSTGIDFGDQQMLDGLSAVVDATVVDAQPIRSTTESELDAAFARASAAFVDWSKAEPVQRRTLLDRCAALLEQRRSKLIRLLRDEAGKTLADAIAEIREAVDLCRYYGAECVDRLMPQPLQSPTGEVNVLHYRGRGVFVCIAPWNFPLAIFLGQVVAALAAGNTVVAKPAEQTPMIGRYVLALLREAGASNGCVEAVYGDATIGQRLVAHESVAGVAFTGSFDSAKAIQRAVASKDGPIVPLIAETGGVNAMVVDSSVLLEQTVDDVITSAFRSSGQRCSALRLLCVQEDIAVPLLEMLKDATRTLNVGDPRDLETDIGPIIDRKALRRLNAYIARVNDSVLYRVDIDERFRETHCGPTIVEVTSIQLLREEVFGPILHVYRFPASKWRDTLAAVQDSGYGLTFGIQTRIERKAQEAVETVGAGNAYINRDMIGAAVGVQPFGGHGLSGTGPKAGGPNYLMRFVLERVVTNNIVATGGNPELLKLSE